MVGNHQVGPGRGARRALDEAFPVVRTAGIDAFAPLVGERGDAPLAEQRAQPAGQVAADHVAVPAIGGPAGDQVGQDRGAPGEPALQRVLEVEQAEIVLAPLAHDDRLRSVRPALGPGPSALTAQLALEVLGVSRDPDRATRRRGPERGRGEITQRLADPGAGLRQQDMRRTAPGARGEDLAHVARVAVLPLAPLGSAAGQVRQLTFDLGFLDQDLAGRRAVGRLLPFGQAGEEPFLRPFGTRDVGCQHLRPGPAKPHERLQRRPGPLALGPVVGPAPREQDAGGAL